MPRENKPGWHHFQSCRNASTIVEERPFKGRAKGEIMNTGFSPRRREPGRARVQSCRLKTNREGHEFTRAVRHLPPTLSFRTRSLGEESAVLRGRSAAQSFFSRPFRKESLPCFCRSPERSRRGSRRCGDFDFPCRESKSQWTYARGIPPFTTNAKDGAPGKKPMRCTTRNPITCTITRERPTRKANNRSSSQRRPGKLAPIKAAERRHILAPDVSPGSAQQKGTESPRDDRNHTKTSRVPPSFLSRSLRKGSRPCFAEALSGSRRGPRPRKAEGRTSVVP